MARSQQRRPVKLAPDREVRVLFVTWDGPRSTYLQALFVPIFAALRSRGYAFHVLQFTWAGSTERAAMAAACSEAGIGYRAVAVWRRPVAIGSLATALAAARTIRRTAGELAIDLLMPRSTLPALAAMFAAGAGAQRIPVLLDADGLPHDERVEFGGASPRGATYRLLRALEAWSVRKADAVTVRTAAAARILADRAGIAAEDGRFHVVSNARDEQRFTPPSPSARASARGCLGIAAEQPLIVYAGASLAGKYDGDALFRFMRSLVARRPNARLLLLMPDHAEAMPFLERYPQLAPACLLRSARPCDVPAWIGAADLGTAFIHPTFSMQAVAAIKLGEYLLCGVPVLATAGVGDTQKIIDETLGRCIATTDDQSLGAAADWFVETVLPGRAGFRQRCRAAGLTNFSLASALDGYEKALCAALQIHR